MISALSGSSALSLLSVFGRGQAASGTQETRRAQPPPPPPPPEGNGASAQSVFEGLLASIDTEKLIAGLDEDGDGKVNEAELTRAFAKSPDTVKPDLTQVMADLVTSLDSDGDQAVSATELSAGLTQLAKGPPPTDPQELAALSPADKAVMLIDALDVDGDRAINAPELQQGLNAKAKQDKSLQELLFNLLLEAKDRQEIVANPYEATMP